MRVGGQSGVDLIVVALAIVEELERIGKALTVKKGVVVATLCA